ncbi:phosphoenolpyruvate synthase, partial [Candidatus Sumerlaeota bacterium]|nr:phosphoenolpyruvate synthase [Candidatus Sumerlaeota bacterium]
MNSNASPVATYVARFDAITLEDVPKVGGKNASLGEMIRELSGYGIRVPDGFAATADAYWRFIEHNRLREPMIEQLGAYKSGKTTLALAGRAIRHLFKQSEIPADLRDAILAAYRDLCAREKNPHLSVAVRSS